MKTKELVIGLLSYLCCVPMLFGQVKGRVTDAATGTPVGNATVSVADSVRVLSDGTGYFGFESSQEMGELTVTCIGYEPITVPYSAGQFLQVKVRPSGTILSEVMVTGYQTGRKLIENAGGISVLNAEDIARQSQVDILPALNTIPGLKMEAYNFGDYRMSIRGSLLRSPWSVRNVKMYWNDIPMTTAAGGNPITLVDAASLGSVEVLKGPAASMYGAGTGGVLIFRSKRAAVGQRSVGTAFTAGSYGLYRATASANISTDNGSLVANYINQHSDGYRPQQAFDQRAINVMGHFTPNSKQTLAFFMLHNRTGSQIAGGLTREQVAENPRQAASEFNILHNTSMNSTNTNVGVSHKYTWSSSFENVTSVFTNYQFVDHPFGSGPSYNGYLRENTFGYGARTQFNYRAQLGRTISGRFAFGAEAQRSFISPKYYENLEGGAPGELYNDNEVVALGHMYFAQAELDIAERLLITLGAGLNALSYDVTDLFKTGDANASGKRTFDPVFSPRLAAVYRIGEHVGAHASISYGFAQPDNSEIFNPGGVINDIRPEKGINYEAGIRGTLARGRFGFDITAYSLQLTDEIVSRRDESWQTFYSNAGKTSHRGVEAAFYYDWLLGLNPVISRIRPWANFTYNDFRFVEYLSNSIDVAGNDIPGISPVVFAGGVDVRGTAGLYVNLVAYRYGRIFLNDTNEDTMAAYWLLNGKVGYAFRISRRWLLDAHAGIENAGNAVYTSLPNLNATGPHPAYFNVSPGRTFHGGLSINYSF
ncbi:TonB-dependent receptor domain-containing protein [Parapedobacter luteus]|nr:TonB-dependent receptor [Parapedobacter luteus]